MLEFCKVKWSYNEGVLLNALKSIEEEELKNYHYRDLVKLVVKYILNADIGIGEYDEIEFDIDNVSEIDNGDYQGTLLYVIPFDTYQPASYEYIMTSCEYGSCSGCDLLKGCICAATTVEDLIKSYMTLCRHLLCNIVKPYNGGWRKNGIFKTVEE